MTVRLGTMTFADWVSLPYRDGWTDTFVFRVSSQACLPPYAYVPLIKRLVTRKVRNLRRSMSLWVQVDAPGQWFGVELHRALRGLQVPYAVTNGRTPDYVDFSYAPWLGVSSPGRPPDVADEPGLALQDDLRCLQALGRMVKGTEDEIASLTGSLVSETERRLDDLRERGWVAFEKGYRITGKRKIKTMPDPFPLWRLTRSGMSLVLRSWGVPKTVTFDRGAREEQHLYQIPGRHRSISRKWAAWLKAAWPQFEIWAGWAEVKLPKTRTIPDALAWGRVRGYETLFWLEVGDDHKGRIEIEKDMRLRLQDALVLARRTNMRLVFAFLGPNWVQDAAGLAFEKLPPEAGVVMAGWTKFGALPVLEWGKVSRR